MKKTEQKYMYIPPSKRFDAQKPTKRLSKTSAIVAVLGGIMLLLSVIGVATVTKTAVLLYLF